MISNLILCYITYSNWRFYKLLNKLCRAQDEQHAQEVARFQEELAEAHSQLQILRKQLDDELAKQPLTNQEASTRFGLLYLLVGLHLYSNQQKSVWEKKKFFCVTVVIFDTD